jgi:hypothetical protein
VILTRSVRSCSRRRAPSSSAGETGRPSTGCVPARTAAGSCHRAGAASLLPSTLSHVHGTPGGSPSTAWTPGAREPRGKVRHSQYSTDRHGHDLVRRLTGLMDELTTSRPRPAAGARRYRRPTRPRGWTQGSAAR